MIKKLIIPFFIFLMLINGLAAQQNKTVAITFNEKQTQFLPGQIINLPYFITNQTDINQTITGTIAVPEGWKIIANAQKAVLQPREKRLLIYTLQIPSNYPVGKYEVQLFAIRKENNDTIDSNQSSIVVGEIERITMSLVSAPETVIAGEIYKASYLVQNLGNTKKKIFIETLNCDVEGNSEVEVDPGKAVSITVNSQTSADLMNARKEYFTVRANISGQVVQSIYNQATVFPSQGIKPDLFFRFPVEASATYLTSNRNENLESSYQFQISGNGSLDPGGKHQLEFLARGPNNTNLSFLGMYDQYYVSYSNKNLELFVGEKAYVFTPLTESSRFGMGTENKVILNNGLSFGFIYVKPRFYEEIQNELAGYTNFAFNTENEIGLFYIAKNNAVTNETNHLSSLTGRFKPFNKTNVELEFSRGLAKTEWDNAFRANVNSHFSIFSFAGNYFYTGKNYPGYFRNSTFYSANLSAQITKKMSLGFYAREDFRNAQLDTFFVTAPYTKSFQSVFNYNLTQRSYLRFYWRQFERQDRLQTDKFHYLTNSINTQFNQRFKKIEYSLLGEVGKTTNFLLTEGENQQMTYRGTANFAYRFNSKHSIRLFGGWSNINSFVSDDQRNVTAGMSITSQLSKNFRANFHIQNAYDIDDYYRNRNLMQLNVDYSFLKKHTLSFRSYYTIFKQQVENPEFTSSLTYSYRFGVPLKQVVNAGDLKGRITYDNGNPAEGIVLNIQNKKAITDKNGEFWINTLQTGIQLLFVERNNFEIDELTNIPTPLEIEIIEDQVTPINLKITKGAKLSGQLVLREENNALFENTASNAGNIIVELKNEFEQFRLTSDPHGNFSFPIVRPGEWTLKIYPNSIPNGYVVDKNEFVLLLKPGAKQELEIDVKPKQRNIIFKSQTTLLTPTKTTTPKEEPVPVIISSKVTNDSVFYSVQVGAFSKRKTNNVGYFEKIPYDFEKQTSKYYKYFIGKFTSYKAAALEKEKLKSTFNSAFIVVLKREE